MSRCNVTFLRFTRNLFGGEIAEPSDCPFRIRENPRFDCIMKDVPKKREPEQCPDYTVFPKDCPLWDGIRLTVKVTK